jgi:Histidine kinase
MSYDKCCNQIPFVVSAFPKFRIKWLPILLYLAWGLITFAAIVTIFVPYSWHDFLWLGIAILSSVQLMVAMRTLTPNAAAGALSSGVATEGTASIAPSNPVQELADLRVRQHLAYDSYDALGQSLTALNIQLQTALKLWETDPHQAHSFLTVAHEQGVTAMQEVRRSIAMLEVEGDAD